MNLPIEFQWEGFLTSKSRHEVSVETVSFQPFRIDFGRDRPKTMKKTQVQSVLGQIQSSRMVLVRSDNFRWKPSI